MSLTCFIIECREMVGKLNSRSIIVSIWQFLEHSETLYNICNRFLHLHMKMWLWYMNIPKNSIVFCKVTHFCKCFVRDYPLKKVHVGVPLGLQNNLVFFLNSCKTYLAFSPYWEWISLINMCTYWQTITVWKMNHFFHLKLNI